MTKTMTRPELMTTLKKRGFKNLSRKSLPELTAIAEDVEFVEILHEKASTGTIIPIEEVVAGDVWPGGQKIGRVQAGKKWTYLFETPTTRRHFLELRSGLLVYVHRQA